MSISPPEPGQPLAAAVEPLLLPRRSQPLIAAAVVAALVAMAAWFVGQGGGFCGGLVRHDAAPAPARGFTVNVNAAGLQELSQLPGLGPATAQRIIDHRREHGPFTSLDGLLDVPGIGAATLDQLQPYLRPIRLREAAP